MKLYMVGSVPKRDSTYDYAHGEGMSHFYGVSWAHNPQAAILDVTKGTPGKYYALPLDIYEVEAKVSKSAN